MKINKVLLIASGLFLTTTFIACDKNEDEDPPTPAIPLIGNQIIISDIAGIPDNVTFNKVRIEISGLSWGVIDIIEVPYTNGKAIIPLPTELSIDKLCKIHRNDIYDCEGYWPAENVDNPNAKGAGLSDNNIIAYNGNEQVGRLYITDWEGVGAAEYKYFVYYHYANEPFTLSGYNYTIKKNRKSYKYEASFQSGWNVYANIKAKESDDPSPDICTTTIPEEVFLRWHFESWVY